MKKATSRRYHNPRSAQRPEPCAEIADQKLRLFPRREVPTSVVLFVEDQVVVGALGPTPRSLVDFFRENADGSRNGDVIVVEEGAFVWRPADAPYKIS
jgi:hypothetical protein